MRDNFNISKDGIQMSYRRFLSDSAAGFAFLLLLAVYYYVPLFTDRTLRQIIASFAKVPVSLGPESKVFILVLSVLLATPLGFAINGISWLLFGQILSVVEKGCLKLSRLGNVTFFPVWDVAATRQLSFLIDSFGMSDDNFEQSSSLLHHAAEFPPLAEFAPETQVRGLVIFLRNIALFMLFGAFVALYSPQVPYGWFFLIVLAAVSVLTIRVPPQNWEQRIFQCACIVVVVGGGYWYFDATGRSDVTRVVVLLSASGVLSAISGVISFYDHCGTALHACFARIAVEGTIPGDLSKSTVPFQAVMSMVQRSAALARVAAQKPK